MVMARAEDLSGRIYGDLKVISRAEDRITPSGQKRRFWNCECLLCGTHKAVSAQSLKSGDATSCGCGRAFKGMQERNTKTCVECGKIFYCPPSDKTVTCSPACRRIHAKKRQTGVKWTEESKNKMSSTVKSQSRDMASIRSLANDAIKASPMYGKYETNVNAIDWHLISPEGEHFYFHSLNHWLRENGEKYFGCKPDSREFKNASSGLSGAKRAAMGKNYGCCTYKGWQVIPTDEDVRGGN